MNALRTSSFLLSMSMPLERDRDEDLVRAYVQRGDDSLLAAEALSCGVSDREQPERLITELRRAAEGYFKAVRLAYGLPATSEHDLQSLLGPEHGEGEGIPPGPWRERLRPIVILDGAAAGQPTWPEWLRRLRLLSADAAFLTPPPRALHR